MENGPIENAISERDNLLEIILNVALLSAGINVLITSSTLVQAGFGAILIIITFIIFLRQKLLKIEQSFEFEAAIPYDSSENTLFVLPEYDFSENFKNNLESAMSENEDIRAIWDDRPIPEMTTGQSYKTDRTTALSLTEEMLEYILLENLSLTTTDYFNRRLVDVKTYERDDLPDILLENRFVELFSKPMEDRAAFQGHPAIDEDEVLPEPLHEANVVFAYGGQGAIFNKFTLTLPRNCKISRDESGGILIESTAITLRISAVSRGFSTVVDHDVVSINKDIEMSDYDLKLMTALIDVEIGYLSLIKNIRREYKWVDEYIRKVENNISLKKYKEDMEVSQLKLAAKLTARELEHRQD